MEINLSYKRCQAYLLEKEKQGFKSTSLFNKHQMESEFSKFTFHPA